MMSSSQPKPSRISRRAFLRLLAGGSLAGLAATLAACQADSQPGGGTPTARSPGQPAVATGSPISTPVAGATASSPTPPGPSGGGQGAVAAATGTSVAIATPANPPGGTPAGVSKKGGRRQVWAWLRMVQAGDIPTSEADYRAHAGQIDVAMPLHGGTLQADGSWTQDDRKTRSAWGQALPQLARQAGHLYMPGMSNDRQGLLAVLDSVGKQQGAVDQLIQMATSSRFDAPWDGFYLDLEGAPINARSNMSGFLFRMARAAKDAGLLLGVSVGAVTQATTGDPRYDDATDLGVASEVADYIDVRCYDYAYLQPRSIAPYWWIEQALQYALKKGVKPQQMTCGLANYSQYTSDPDNQAFGDQVTYDRAMQLVKQSGASVQWIESNENGLVRESYADFGKGFVWIHDEKSYRYGLSLTDQYKLLGNTIFAPGMGNNAQWQVIADWGAARKA